jgi:hypothetical protein
MSILYFYKVTLSDRLFIAAAYKFDCLSLKATFNLPWLHFFLSLKLGGNRVNGPTEVKIQKLNHALLASW